jgi:hypothetical protein
MNPTSGHVDQLPLHELLKVIEYHGILPYLTEDEMAGYENQHIELLVKWKEIKAAGAALIRLREENARRAAAAQIDQIPPDPPGPNPKNPLKRTAEYDNTGALGHTVKKVKTMASAGEQDSPLLQDVRGTGAAPKSALKRAAENNNTEDIKNREENVRTILQDVRDTGAAPKSALKRPAVDDVDISSNPKRVKFTDVHKTPAVQPSPTQISMDSIATHITCCACLDSHPQSSVLQLGCKGEGESDFHAYVSFPSRFRRDAQY